MTKPRIIAFYLPQYHPTPRNDKWWGKGFTEWTNVAKAKPLFPGHYQPHVPADLGFYDLRLPENREAQAIMAKEYGIYGFCYYHYWFEQGFEELEKPLDEVVRLGQPDFPFCICWANEDWCAKFWNMDGTVGKKILAEQKYPGKEDNEAHFYRLLPAFKDSRYIRYNNKLVFVIYNPFGFVGIADFMSQWNNLAEQNGLPHFYFMAYNQNVDKNYDRIKDMGFDSVISCRLYHMGVSRNLFKRFYLKCLRPLVQLPIIVNYKKEYKKLIGPYENKEDVIPTIVPNWDHTPRSGKAGMVVTNTTPEFFEKHVADVYSLLEEKKNEEQLCFLKSWNEWGEGNYLEPDQKFGSAYLVATRSVFIKN